MIDTEAKTSLQLPSILCEMNQCCSRGNQPIYSTMAKLQVFSTRDPYDNLVKKLPPPSSLKLSNSSSVGSSETSNKKARKKKKKYRRLDQQRAKGRKNTSLTPATGANSGIRKNIF